MKTLKYVALVVSLLAMLLLGCQIGKNVLVTKTDVSIKAEMTSQSLAKRIDSLISEIDSTGTINVRELKDVLVAMRDFLSDYAKKNKGDSNIYATEKK